MGARILLKFERSKNLLSINLTRNLSHQQKGTLNLHPEAEDANAKHFQKVASIYNEFDKFISMGLYSKWRKATIDNVNITNESQILDAPGGTGLNTIRLLEKAKHLQHDSKFQIIVVDASSYMLKVGEDDCKRLGYNPKFVRFIEGDLHKLPFANESFDTVLTCLAIRSSIDFNVAFKEINRVLKSKGKLIVFEICYSQNPTVMQRLFCNYIKYISTTIERIKWGNLGASEYAVREMQNTISKCNIQGLIKDSGFQKLEFKPLSFGIVGITIGHKL